MGARHHEHLVGRAAPVRAHHEHPLVVDDHPVLRLALRLGHRAEQARLAEAAEAGLLLGDLAGHERDAEELPVRVVERCTRLPAGVHDRLGVAHGGAAGVVLHAIADRGHRQAGVLVVEVGPAVGVLGAEDQHLVDAAGRRLREHRTEVLDPQRFAALERREQVRHHPHEPGAARAVGLERRRRGLLVAGAERALPRRVGLHRQLARDQLPGSRGSLGRHGDPAPRERVEPELTHTEPGGSTVRTLPR